MQSSNRIYPSKAAIEPLRVLHVVEACGGGVFEIIRVLTQRLAELGVRNGVAYGVRAETPHDVATALADAAEVFPLRWTTRSLSAQIVAGRQLRRICRLWRPDIVHLHSSFAGIVGVTVLDRRFPLVYTPHGYSFTMATASAVSRGTFRAAERYVARRVAGIGAVSEHEAQLARGVIGAERVFVVENGIPELDRPSCQEPESVPLGHTVVGMGRISAARRPHEAAVILDAVRDLAALRWVGGAGDLPDGYEALADRDIAITGWLPREDALAQLRSASVYLHWAAWDGAPLSVLEAMAYNVPVLGSDIPPLRGILGEEQVAGSVEQAIAVLRSLLTDPDTYRQWQLRQRERRTRYGALQMAASWLRHYRRIVGADLDGLNPSDRSARYHFVRR